MTDQERAKRMLELELKVDQMMSQQKQLITAITGDKELKTDGLIHRIGRLEQMTEDRGRDMTGIQQFVFQILESTEANLDTKFKKLSENITEQLVPLNAFKKDYTDFKTRFDLYMNLITNGRIWRFIWKVIIASAVIGSILVLWYKGGYELMIKYFKLLLK